MFTAEVEYLGNLRTQAIHLRSGNKLITDAPLDNNGKGENFSPTDMMSTSLACCALTIMGILAEKHSIDMKGTKVNVTKNMEANPRRVGEIVVEFNLPKSYSDKEKILLENAAKTCPVSKSLSSELKQTFLFNYPLVVV